VLCVESLIHFLQHRHRTFQGSTCSTCGSFSRIVRRSTSDLIFRTRGGEKDDGVDSSVLTLPVRDSKGDDSLLTLAVGDGKGIDSYSFTWTLAVGDGKGIDLTSCTSISASGFEGSCCVVEMSAGAGESARSLMMITSVWGQERKGGDEIYRRGPRTTVPSVWTGS